MAGDHGTPRDRTGDKREAQGPGVRGVLRLVSFYCNHHLIFSSQGHIADNCVAHEAFGTLMYYYMTSEAGQRSESTVLQLCII